MKAITYLIFLATTLATLSYSVVASAATYSSTTTVTNNLKGTNLQFDMTAEGCQPIQVTDGYSQDFNPRDLPSGDSSISKLSSSDSGDLVSCTWKVDQYTLLPNGTRTLNYTNYCAITVAHTPGNIQDSCEPAKGESTVFVGLDVENVSNPSGVTSTVGFYQNSQE